MQADRVELMFECTAIRFIHGHALMQDQVAVTDSLGPIRLSISTGQVRMKSLLLDGFKRKREGGGGKGKDVLPLSPTHEKLKI